MSKLSGFVVFVALTFVSVGQGAVSYLGKDNFVSLDSLQNKALLHINYPGKLSGICGVSIRLSKEFLHNGETKKVADGLVVSEMQGGTLAPIVGAKSVRYDLKALQTYVTMVNIETKSGLSLRNFFRSLDTGSGLEKDLKTSGIVTATRCR